MGDGILGLFVEQTLAVWTLLNESWYLIIITFIYILLNFFLFVFSGKSVKIITLIVNIYPFQSKLKISDEREFLTAAVTPVLNLTNDFKQSTPKLLEVVCPL